MLSAAIAATFASCACAVVEDEGSARPSVAGSLRDSLWRRKPDEKSSREGTTCLGVLRCSTSVSTLSLSPSEEAYLSMRHDLCPGVEVLREEEPPPYSRSPEEPWHLGSGSRAWSGGAHAGACQSRGEPGGALANAAWSMRSITPLAGRTREYRWRSPCTV